MKKPDIHRLFEFQKLLSEFSQIDRATHRKHGDNFVHENDTEHSYDLAMTAWYLAEYFPHLDVNKLIRYALIHDLVEVHAGDTYIYGAQADLDSKQEREQIALEKLQKDWSDFPSLLKDINTYEKHDSEESKFVYALDKIMPILLVYINDGYTWKREGITPERLHEAKKHKVALSPEIDSYYEQLYKLLTRNRHLFSK